MIFDQKLNVPGGSTEFKSGVKKACNKPTYDRYVENTSMPKPFRVNAPKTHDINTNYTYLHMRIRIIYFVFSESIEFVAL